MHELNFINYLKKTIKYKTDVICGIGDDAAVLKHTKNKHLLFASDMLVEGVHFSRNTKPIDIGWKAIAVNASDIAAMGGVPKYVVISAGLPERRALKVLKRILEGAKKACKKFNIQIVGGDTNKGKNLVIDVSIIGEVEKKCLTLRSGAKQGDFIFVTGELGKGKEKHLNFIPRLKEARTLVRNFKINSMIDISDGLFLDFYRIAEASRVGGVIYKSLIPLGEGAKMKNALSGGEDFELLFTLSIKEAKRLILYMARHKYPPVTLIGEVVLKSRGLNFVGDEGRVSKIRPKGYMHF